MLWLSDFGHKLRVIFVIFLGRFVPQSASES